MKPFRGQQLVCDRYIFVVSGQVEAIDIWYLQVPPDDIAPSSHRYPWGWKRHDKAPENKQQQQPQQQPSQGKKQDLDWVVGSWYGIALCERVFPFEPESTTKFQVQSTW